MIKKVNNEDPYGINCRSRLRPPEGQALLRTCALLQFLSKIGSNVMNLLTSD
jgi:hypothetical protein